jgi:hypothetical protein
MMNSILFGNGYWANIVKEKIVSLTNLVLIVDSKTDISIWNKINVDIAFVCSSTSSHYDIVKKCLDNNIKYIFCTKPFTGDYKKAKELFSIANRKGINIFVDNLFLYRKEIIDIKLKNIQNFVFHWEKPHKINMESIYDSLLYHDLYLLLKWSKSKKWKVIFVDRYDDSLYLYMINEYYQTCYFEYNISGRKNKWIIFGDFVVNLTTTKQDSLKECIIDMLQGDIDFDSNKKVTLDTLKLLNFIQKNHDK